jgi:hypothetical protein
MFTTFLFSLKEKGLLFTSFFVSKNIAEWDRLIFVNILREPNAASSG